MLFRILKNDLKRKKVMNTIIFLFILFATIFMASSSNNIISSLNGIDYYNEKANLSTYVAFLNGSDDKETLINSLNKLEEVKEIKNENCIYFSYGSFYKDGETIDALKNNVGALNVSDMVLNYFDKDNKKIETVEEGSVYVIQKYYEDAGLKEGDIITIKCNDYSLNLKVKGYYKDCILGATAISLGRIIVNENDYNKLANNKDLSNFEFIYVYGEESAKIQKIIDECRTLIYCLTKDKMKTVYFTDIIVSAILLVLSICLILISFSVLRFAINYTIGEDFKELGVMKAIGISNRKIRFLCIVKYWFLAIVATLIGFFISIPVSNLMIKSISKAMYMGNDNVILINVIACLVVVFVIIGYSYLMTKRVLKLSAIDAIRNINFNERTKQKSKIRLSKKLKNTKFYMAINDLLSSPKKYLTALITFTLCFSFLITITSIVDTMKGDTLVSFCNMPKFDVCVNKFTMMGSDYTSEDRINVCNEVENELKAKGKDVECSVEICYLVNFYNGEYAASCQTYQGYNTDIEGYAYYKGYAPKEKNEIAITETIAKKLDAKIGDKIGIKGLEGEFIITGYIQSISNMGESARFSPKTDLTGFDCVGSSGILVTINEHDKEDCVNFIYDFYGEDIVEDVNEMMTEYIDLTMFDSLEIIAIVLSIMIIIFVTILMERSFISNEKKDIALLKALGYRDLEVAWYHSLRFGIICITAVLISIAISYPLNYLISNAILSSIAGGGKWVLDINYLKIVIYGFIALGISLLIAFIVSLHTKQIKAKDTASIE